MTHRTLSTQPDHHIWMGFYVLCETSGPSGKIYTTTKQRAMELVTNQIDVANEGWERSTRVPYELYSKYDEKDRKLVVKKIPVYP